jgi:hypothetical protein
MKARAQQYIVDEKGRRKAVLVSIEQYERMQEDLHDLAVVAERRDEKPIDFDVMKRRLSKRGRV